MWFWNKYFRWLISRVFLLHVPYDIMSTYLLRYCLMFIKTWYILVIMQSIAYQKSHVRELFNEISFLNWKMLCMWNLGTIYLLLTTLLVKCLKKATFGQIFVFLETLHCKVYMSKIQTEKKNNSFPKLYVRFLQITNIINIRFYRIANMSLGFFYYKFSCWILNTYL